MKRFDKKMILGIVTFFVSILLFSSCDKQENIISELDEGIVIEKIDTNTYYSDSFLPMSIGNYWRYNAGNYTSITDTIRIEGELYYKFESLIGWDAKGIEYLRLDENNNLIEKSPTYPDKSYLHAKFNSEVGTKFFTSNDETVNDYEVTLKSNSNDTIKFEFRMIYNSSLIVEKYIVAYKRGLGFTGNWKEAKIDNVIYRYE